MDYRADLLNTVFDRVRSRLHKRPDSLCRFIERWHGSGGGIEAWFKVKFVASIPKNLAVVRTGGAFRRQRAETGVAPLKTEGKKITRI